MKRKDNWKVPLVLLFWIGLVLCGCSDVEPLSASDLGSAQPAGASAYPGASNAQATIDAGQRQLADLSRKATQDSLVVSMTESAFSQSTQAADQFQKLEYEQQATAISQEIQRAAATQQSLAQATQTALEATTAAQKTAAAATQLVEQMTATQAAQDQATQKALAAQTAAAGSTLTAYSLTATPLAEKKEKTETQQAYFILKTQAQQTAQANAASTEFPLTATPYAATQATLLHQEYNREQQNFTEQVVTPLMPVFSILVILSTTFGAYLVYSRMTRPPWPQRVRKAQANFHRPQFINGKFSDSVSLHRLTPPVPPPAESNGPERKEKARIEVIAAAEPPIADWIAEVEHRLGHAEEQER